LDLIYAHPHTTQAISLLWQHYHTAHPTLSSTFLSATIPPKTYSSMVDLAKRYPNFVIPLPRDPTGENQAAPATGEQPAFEMFYLQWLFHPTPSVTSPSATPEATRDIPKLPIASVIFTPLAEFKNASEWAQPQLVLTHYPDLHNNPIPLDLQSTSNAADQPQHHPVVLMRGEISPSQAKSSLTSPLPSTHLALTQAQAQLLALALQRFYCSELVPEVGESAEAKRLREERMKSLRDFRERPAEWDWKGLIKLAYAGVV
jgi:ATP synthase F1 complex assembly factor 1